MKSAVPRSKDKPADENAAQPTIPVGTQVVTLVEVRGGDGNILYPLNSVGVVLDVPTNTAGTYRVRFPDGGDVSISSREIVSRKHFQRDLTSEIEKPGKVNGLTRFVIYTCVIGSRAYGLDSSSSDVDKRGIYLPPAKLHWSLAGVPEQLEKDETQEVYWELQKFLRLALKANPNVLECLYTPLVEMASPIAEELLASRDRFLSKLVYQTFNGYVLSQFKKMEQDLRNQGEIRWKHAMHLVRLLLSGIIVLRDGFVPVRVEQYREQLLAIKEGERAWEDVNEWRLGLHKEFAEVFATTKLPERPDYEWADEFLVKARRSMVDVE